MVLLTLTGTWMLVVVSHGYIPIIIFSRKHTHTHTHIHKLTNSIDQLIEFFYLVLIVYAIVSGNIASLWIAPYLIFASVIALVEVNRNLGNFDAPESGVWYAGYCASSVGNKLIPIPFFFVVVVVYFVADNVTDGQHFCLC
jgi:hypothetical protein